MIEIEGLGLDIAERRILDDVSLHVPETGFQMIIGPNGAGKTTLLKCLLAMRRDYRGRIYVDGKDPRVCSGKVRAGLMAYVPQMPEFGFTMDVRAFMETARFTFEESRAACARVIEACLERTDTKHLASAYMDELSGGERQRVLVSAALAQQARLLILDEPTASLDPNHRVELTALLSSLCRDDGHTILMVTHDWNDFAGIPARVLALKAGKKAFECELSRLPDHLQDLFGCRFEHLQSARGLVSVPLGGA